MLETMQRRCQDLTAGSEQMSASRSRIRRLAVCWEGVLGVWAVVSMKCMLHGQERILMTDPNKVHGPLCQVLDI